MFTKVLIANRGEIACRIIRTCRQMGIAAVAVYSDADRDALHVRQADHAVRLGPAPSADSYLRGDLIVQAALATGAQAIHPGYGFLSENPDFVDAVAAAGLIFVGPSAAAIRAMGLKDAAKALMERAGVPVVPGYHGDNQDDDHLARAAGRIGYPVLIKAIAGGGGRGMRLVDAPQDFATALAAARSEARAAFGIDRVLIEKYIRHPRHIEVQVFGDGRTALHLFERDCSLQRRHQKVIEEAPAPGMTASLRAAMGQAAVQAASAIGYAGAGTVEFIAETAKGLREDGFWFMEMNTRLQVEHPVTEAITGIDLVAWQLRVAAGAGLPMSQAELTIRGHAIEARLYAEDVPAGFLPCVGRLDHLAFPPGVRIETGVATGDTVTPWYDPMIAKVIAQGADRDAARLALAAALDQVQVAGCVTNLGFLQRLVRQDAFVAGDVETGLVASNLPALAAPAALDLPRLGLAALVALGLDGAAGPHQGFTLWAPLAHPVSLVHGADVLTLALSFVPDGVRVQRGTEAVTLTRRGANWWCDGTRLPHALRHGAHVTVCGPDPMTLGLPDLLARRAIIAAGDHVIAPMPGRVREVSTGTGQNVKAGERLLVLEAMKMEHVMRAPRDGVVSDVRCCPGGQVSAGDLLVVLEPAA